MNIFEIKNSSPKKGFTLIELLVAMFVVSVGLIGAIAFFNTSLQSQYESKNDVIASGLTQESAELVRNLVEHNDLNGAANWYDEVYNGSSFCSRIDRDILVDGANRYKCFTPAAGKTNEICQHAVNGTYYQCPSAMGENDKETIFTRTMTIDGYDMDGNGNKYEFDDGTDCLQITVSVSWEGNETEANDIICAPR